mgnify:CR=1 FL=1
MKKAALFCNHPPHVEWVYGKGRREKVAALTDLYPEIVTADSFPRHAAALKGVEAVFSTWGMPALTGEQLAQLPSFRALFYAAGAVKPFAEPLIERGIVVVSAWGANAVPVAEYTLSQILLATKGYFRNTRDSKDAGRRRGGQCFSGRGNYGETIALIGAGQVGRKLMEMLKPFALSVLAVDPYLSEEEARRLGVRKATLQEAFAQAYVVSNHLPNIPSTVGLLNRPLFASMRPDATFINTGRGAQVVEPDLVAVLKERPDLTALLDVTDPEPPAEGSEFYTLPNVHLTSHIAGSLGDEVVRMADYMIEEFQRWEQGEPLHYQITKDMLPRLA